MMQHHERSHVLKMKSSIFAFLFIASHALGDELKLGFYPAHAEENGPTIVAIDDLERSADRTVFYDESKNFDLGLGRISGADGAVARFKFDQIERFLVQEKHKDLIVVYFDKTLMRHEKSFVRLRAEEVSEKMRQVGYKRVVVLGAHSMGVHYVADTDLSGTKEEQGRTAQSAAGSEDEPVGGQLPQTNLDWITPK